MLRAVIFDFDGVITDSEILHFRAFNRVLAPLGAEITMKDYYKTYLGLTDVDCFNLLIREGHLKTDTQKLVLSEAEGIEELVRQKDQIFKNLAKTEGRIIEGVQGFLKMLRHNSIPMAICSGALLAEIELILEEARLRHFFEVIVSAEQVRKGKPSPDGFLLTLRKLNRSVIPAKAGIQNPILPNQCIVIEDSHWGLQAAKAAGMHTVAVTNSYDARQLALAEKIVARLSELSISDLQQLCV
jgi:beta-phosphoglucomutase